MGRRARQASLAQGTLDMLILKMLTLEPMHGYSIGVRIEQISSASSRSTRRIIMDTYLNREASVEPINEKESASEFEPVVLARVSEVTGVAPGGTGDPDDNIVWGNDN